MLNFLPFYTLLALIFIGVFNYQVKASKANCPIEGISAYKINLPPSNASTLKTSCISDKTCCFYIAKYGQDPYSYNVSICAPIDYNKTTKTYNASSAYVTNSKFFCNDLKYSAMKSNSAFAIVDCMCQQQSTGATVLSLNSFRGGTTIAATILALLIFVH